MALLYEVYKISIIKEVYKINEEIVDTPGEKQKKITNGQ